MRFAGTPRVLWVLLPARRAAARIAPAGYAGSAARRGPLVLAIGLAAAPVLRPAWRAGRTFPALASWYGPEFEGRPTAGGELFSSRELTAAHRTPRFGTRLVVFHPVTGRMVLVRGNDRGPWVAGGELDLSGAAAEAIGLLPHGAGRVLMHGVPSGTGGQPTPALTLGPAENYNLGDIPAGERPRLRARPFGHSDDGEEYRPPAPPARDRRRGYGRAGASGPGAPRRECTPECGPRVLRPQAPTAGHR